MMSVSPFLFGEDMRKEKIKNTNLGTSILIDFIKHTYPDKKT